jgi:hypothetical protein
MPWPDANNFVKVFLEISSWTGIFTGHTVGFMKPDRLQRQSANHLLGVPRAIKVCP